jgi:hypothetical protein
MTPLTQHWRAIETQVAQQIVRREGPDWIARPVVARPVPAVGGPAPAGPRPLGLSNR